MLYVKGKGDSYTAKAVDLAPLLLSKDGGNAVVKLGMNQRYM